MTAALNRAHLEGLIAAGKSGEAIEILESGQEIPGLEGFNSSGDTILHVCGASQGIDPRVIELLVARGLDVDGRARYDDVSPLLIACSCSNLQAARALLDGGADPRKASSSGRTALHRAAWSGCVPIGELLLARGADIEAIDHSWWTPLYTAAMHNEAAFASFLIVHGAKLEIVLGKIRLEYVAVGAETKAVFEAAKAEMAMRREAEYLAPLNSRGLGL